MPALDCFLRQLQIAQHSFGVRGDACADVWLSLGVLYISMQNHQEFASENEQLEQQAKHAFMKAFLIRSQSPASARVTESLDEIKSWLNDVYDERLDYSKLQQQYGHLLRDDDQSGILRLKSRAVSIVRSKTPQPSVPSVNLSGLVNLASSATAASTSVVVQTPKIRLNTSATLPPVNALPPISPRANSVSVSGKITIGSARSSVSPTSASPPLSLNTAPVIVSANAAASAVSNAASSAANTAATLSAEIRKPMIIIGKRN